MIGAVIGDIIGSRFEYLATQEQEVNFFHPACSFTDDTVCSAAIALATLRVKENIQLHQQLKSKYPIDYQKEFLQPDEERVAQIYRKILKETTQHHPLIGYGKFFGQWVTSTSSEPYQSLGNGALMRISPIILLSKTLEEAQYLSYCASMITHNHPDSLKTVEHYVNIAWMCKTWNDSISKLKEHINTYLHQHHIILNSVKDYHQAKGFFVLAPDTLVRALASFLEGNSFDETIKNVLFIGSDTDTTGAIAATFAEMAYGIPFEYLEKTFTYFNYTNLYLLQAIVQPYCHLNLNTIGHLFNHNSFSNKYQLWYQTILKTTLEDPTAAWDPLAPLEESEYYSDIDKALLYERDNWFGKFLKKLGFRTYK